MTEKKKKLTAKQQAFVNEYCIDKNATKAAIRSGYSEKTAHSIAGENLKKPEIKKAIAFKLENAAKKNDITLDRVLKEYARIAFGDMRNFIGPDGRTIDLADMDDDTAASISAFNRIDGENSTITTVKQHDKMKALDSLMRHLGGFANDSLTVNASESLRELLQAATNVGHILPSEAKKREERLHS